MIIFATSIFSKKNSRMSMPIGISEDFALRATPKTARKDQCAFTQKFEVSSFRFQVSDLGWGKKYYV